jgi:hypothetical protein
MDLKVYHQLPLLKGKEVHPIHQIMDKEITTTTEVLPEVVVVDQEAHLLVEVQPVEEVV